MGYTAPYSSAITLYAFPESVSMNCYADVALLLRQAQLRLSVVLVFAQEGIRNDNAHCDVTRKARTT